jgi:hypothetical protein
MLTAASSLAGTRQREAAWDGKRGLARHGYCEQLLTLGAANLDGPALPPAVGLNSQIERDKFRQLERSVSRRKFAHADLALRVLRAHKGKTIFGHGEPWVGVEPTVTKADLKFSYGIN